MKKILLTMLAFVAMVVNAQEIYTTLTFPDENSANNAVGAYTKEWTATIGENSWTIANFNNNNWNNWSYIKCGRKSDASVATIATAEAYEAKINKVVVTLDKADASKINSLTLTVNDGENSNDYNAATIAAGDVEFNITTPVENATYTITFDMPATGANGTFQVSKVEYYKESSSPILKADLNEIYLWNYTTTAWKDYQAMEKVINITAANLTENITYVMESSGKAQGSDVGEGMKFKIANNGLYEANSGSLKLTVTSKVPGTFEDAILVKSGDMEVRIPVTLKVAGTEGDGYLVPEDLAPLTVADALLVHSIMPLNASYMTDETHKFDTFNGDYGQRCVTGIVTEVTEVSTQYNNTTFIIKDSADDEEGLTVYRVKGLNSEDITDENFIKVGDKVVVEGDLCDYNGKAELKTGKAGDDNTGFIYSIDGGITDAISSVNDIQKFDAIYNIAGQRVNANTKGLVIIDGKAQVIK